MRDELNTHLFEICAVAGLRFIKRKIECLFQGDKSMMLRETLLKFYFFDLFTMRSTDIVEHIKQLEKINEKQKEINTSDEDDDHHHTEKQKSCK